MHKKTWFVDPTVVVLPLVLLGVGLLVLGHSAHVQAGSLTTPPGTENPQLDLKVSAPRASVDLSSSVKLIDPNVVPPGEVVTYTVMLNNTGPDDAPNVGLTDTLPISTTYFPNSLTYPPESGMGGYNPATREITWTGTVSAGLPVTVTFVVTIDIALADGTSVVNTAIITNGAGMSHQWVATATVSELPYIVDTGPADGATDVPVTAPLVITFSEPVVTNTFQYTVTAEPAGGFVIVWFPDRTGVFLSPNPYWPDAETITVTISAQDEEGDSLVPGPVPNPWSFTTRNELPYIVDTGPADGTTDVPVTASLVITFSEPVVTNTFQYTVTAEPAGGFVIVWFPDRTGVFLSPNPYWPDAETITVTISAQDEEGDSLMPGPVPNPWSFTTKSFYHVYLPLVVRDHHGR